MTRPRFLDRIAYALALAVLLFQLGHVLYARIGEARYFAWAPHDVMWSFELRVELPGETLDHEAALRRYRMRRARRHEHAIEHVKLAVRQFETTHGVGDEARVTLTYRRNGGPQTTWSFPEERP